jgi:prepilin-type processing-associated H-X9-DG protein
VGWISGKKMAVLQRPAEFCLYGDSSCMGFGPYNNGSFTAWQQGGWPNNRPDFGHNGGLNVGFADGHAKWAKPNNLTHNQFCRVSGMPAP